MRNLLEHQIKEWVSIQAKFVSIHNSASIHMDELLNRDLHQVETLDISTQAFMILIEQIKIQEILLKPMLVIPLKVISNKIEIAVPNRLIEIESQLDIEPPSLYLLDWDTSKYLKIYEEYKVPLKFDLMKSDIIGIYTTYREFRDRISIENDWEFSRGVYIEYYPSDYRST